MGAAAAPAMPASRPRWSWLWSARDDVLFNLLPFWLGLAAAAILYGAHAWTASGDAAWTVTISGHVIVLGAVFLYLYGPLVDAPHLWATIARTYTDRDEWKARRTLFLAS
ncbi:MAG: hypothetical protein JST92_08735, partial [Deltaproteobacteria bacterium]|nr:hypothetical protein [Deltaproteobacteria bacterium]